MNLVSYFNITKDVNPTFYTVDPNTQWKHFNFDKLTNKEQCQIVERACLNEARYERLKTIGYAAAALFSGAAIVVTAVFLSKVAIFIIGFVLLPLNFFIPISFTSLISTDLCTALLTFYAIKTVWTRLEVKMQPHWKYSEHLYKQAKAAELKILAFTTQNK